MYRHLFQMDVDSFLKTMERIMNVTMDALEVGERIINGPLDPDSKTIEGEQYNTMYVASMDSDQPQASGSFQQ